MSTILNVIPVGGEEPVHIAGSECFCHPLMIEGQSILVHNADDCREAKERQGVTEPGKFWVHVRHTDPHEHS